MDTPKLRKEATKFRKFLLEQGFEMAQLSVYMKVCSGREQLEARARQVERHLPEFGEVQVISITDKQYEKALRFSGRKRHRDRKNPGQIALF